MTRFVRALAVGFALLLPRATTSGADAGAMPTPQRTFLVKVWGVDEGMPVASVTDVEQTPEGYLWIGTLLSGVVRFDGSRFESFSSANTPQLRSMGVRSLMVDRSGTLWLCQYNGALATWTPQGFAEVGRNLGRPDRLLWSVPGAVIFLNNDGRLLHGTNTVQGWQWRFLALPEAAAQPQPCADSSGRIWYVASDRSLRTWRDGQFHAFTNLPGLPQQRLTALADDAAGYVWVGTDQSLARWSGDRFEVMTPTNAESRITVKRIIPAGSRGMWVEANGRMRRCEGWNWVAESPEWIRQLGRATTLRFVRTDARGGVWTGYEDMGLIHLEEGGELKRLTVRDGLPSDDVRFAVPDREGNVWSGYERGYLLQVRPRTFHTISREQGLQDAPVTTLCEDGAGAIWLGGLNGRLTRYQNGQCENFSLPRTLRPSATCVAADAQGRLWVAAGTAGLFRWEGGDFRQVLAREQLSGDVRILYGARDGRMWLAMLDSAYVLGEAGLTRVWAAANPGEYPSAITETADGTIWLGTFHGDLMRWRGGDFERIRLPSNAGWLGRSWALCPAADGGLWIGTSSGGLLRWNAGQFRHYKMADGLPSDAIHQVLTDGMGNLWLVTGAGVVRIDESVMERFDRGELATLATSVYGRSEGLLTIGAAIEFQPNSLRTKDGSLWFAMANGAASVRPAEVRLNPLPPAVAIENVLVNGRSVWPTNPASVIVSAPLPGAMDAATPASALRIGPGRCDVEWRFSGLSMAATERVRFRYRLRGVQAGWTLPQASRSAVYYALLPGDYTFEVVACNSDGVWQEEPARFRLVVRPHVYETAWFRIAMFFLLVAGLALSVFVLVRRRLQRRLAILAQQREMDRERARIAQDLHDDLGAGLTEIGLLGSLAQRPAQAPARVQEHLRHITEKSREMVTSLDEIVWSLNPKQDSLGDLCRYFSEYAQQFLQITPLRCRIEVREQLPRVTLIPDQRQNLLLAYKEALTNVVRHARATEVRITMDMEGEHFVVIVADDGCGVNAAAAGPGADGLANMTRRLEAIGGRCEVRSGVGGGTTVRLVLPLVRITELSRLPA
jgi:signal transduction histidine kinase/ligand-binding sensor domain-containing protein